MAEKLILVEFDDCLVKSRRVVEKWVNSNRRRLNLDKKVNLYYGDDWTDVVHILGVSEDTKTIVLNEIWSKLQNTNLRPAPEAKTAIKILSDTYRIAILTDRPNYCLEKTKKQAQKLFGINEVYCRNAVIPDNPEADKIECCKYLGANFLIDNQIEITYAAAIYGINSITVGSCDFRRVGAMPLWRCKTWGQVISAVLRTQ